MWEFAAGRMRICWRQRPATSVRLTSRRASRRSRKLHSSWNPPAGRWVPSMNARPYVEPHQQMLIECYLKAPGLLFMGPFVVCGEGTKELQHC